MCGVRGNVSYNQLRMKKLVTMLAVIGVLASCSKETPVVPAGQQGQNELELTQGPLVDLRDSDPNAKGVRYTFGAEVEPLEIASEGFDGSETQKTEARAIQTIFGEGNREGSQAKFIRYRLDTKFSSVTVQGFIYEGLSMARFLANAEVSPNGTGLSFSVSEDKVKANAGLAKLVERTKVPGNQVKLALIVNFNKSKTTADAEENRFDNKGAYLVNYKQGKAIELPENFVVLKSLANPLEWSNGKLQVKSGHTMKLTTQGYVLAIRFRNHTQSTVFKHTWSNPAQEPFLSDMNGNPVAGKDAVTVKRPDLRLQLRVTGLSSNYAVRFYFDAKNQRFSTGPILNVGGNGITQTREFTTPGFTKIGEFSGQPEFQVTFQNTNDSIFRVPVESDRTTGQTEPPKATINKSPLREGEPIALIYCPMSEDQGYIWFRASDDLFYDQSLFSMSHDIVPPSTVKQLRFYSTNKVKSAIKKTVGIAASSTAPYQGFKADGKVFLPVFHIVPLKDAQKVNSTGVKNNNDQVERAARWKLYQERNKEAVPVPNS